MVDLLKIRAARLGDLKSITEIYNEAIKKTVATFDTEVKTLEEQKKWFIKHSTRNPIIIAENDDEIIGWASLSEYSTKYAYSDTAEISLYIKEKFQGKGIGKQLMSSIIDEGKKVGLHAVIARITDGNKTSIRLHKSVGFKHVGIMKEVGYKFGKRLDVHIMEKIYSEK